MTAARKRRERLLFAFVSVIASAVTTAINGDAD